MQLYQRYSCLSGFHAATDQHTPQLPLAPKGIPAACLCHSQVEALIAAAKLQAADLQNISANLPQHLPSLPGHEVLGVIRPGTYPPAMLLNSCLCTTCNGQMRVATVALQVQLYNCGQACQQEPWLNAERAQQLEQAVQVRQ
jgi:hypothetical protein